jgi:phosphatidylserine/phosphatidylglycerophosphate/cardiolipin synthase-like enzyme
MGDGSSVVSWLDARVGDGLEAVVRAKHRRRLRRVGAVEAIDPGAGWWAAGDPPPREGCSLQVLIDGADYFAALAEAIENAQRYIHVTGWHLAPYFELARGRTPVVLGELLAEAAERLDVSVLVWAGSPVPLFHPTRGEIREAIQTLTRGTRIHCVPDPRERPLHCHHEKTVVVDGEIAFVGGIDATDLGGDRYDTPAHPARRRLGWHDVSTRLHGPAVADVENHFRLRWHELTGEQLEKGSEVAHAGPHTVQVVRTVPDGMYDALPRGDFRIFESYLRAITHAERFIYLENQFLWSTELVRHLADKLRHPPCPEFRVLIVLPSRANNGQDDTSGQIGVLEAADNGAGHLLVVTLRSLSGTRDDRLYVHAKVGIVDDHWLTVGSANLNAHSLLNDSEMNVVTDHAQLVKETRLRLWSEHLQIEPQELASSDPCADIDERWRPVALEQLRKLNQRQPATHRLLALPGTSRRSRRLLGPLAGLIDDG